jgi:hypothetical protein
MIVWGYSDGRQDPAMLAPRTEEMILRKKDRDSVPGPFV